MKKGLLLALIIPALLLPVVGFAADQNNEQMTPVQSETPTDPAPQNKGQATLTVRVTGIRNDKGVIRIALFNDKQSYDDKQPAGIAALRRGPLPIQNGQADWVLKDLPYGDYAIKLFHDEDNSGKLKKNFIGRPKEGIGFSNNPKVTTKAPTFDEVKFTVDQPQASINIQMINP